MNAYEVIQPIDTPESRDLERVLCDTLTRNCEALGIPTSLLRMDENAPPFARIHRPLFVPQS